MSYSISLANNGVPVEVKSHEEGSTFALGGITTAELDITYNYAWFFYHFLDEKDGIRWLYGKAAKDCINKLEEAVRVLSDNPHTHGDESYPKSDEGLAKFKGRAYLRKQGGYWCPTPGNAGHALAILLEWAKQHPDAVFEGD